jgi:hypothetical protein
MYLFIYVFIYLGFQVMNLGLLPISLAGPILTRLAGEIKINQKFSFSFFLCFFHLFMYLCIWAVQVMNLGPRPVDLAGLRLADQLEGVSADTCDPSNCFVIGSGGPQCAEQSTVLASGAVKVFRRNANCSFSFGLSSKRDAALLLSGTTPLDR